MRQRMKRKKKMKQTKVDEERRRKISVTGFKWIQLWASSVVANAFRDENDTYRRGSPNEVGSIRHGARILLFYLNPVG
jgi:hypothetical protein